MRISRFVAILGWSSVFGLMWLMVLRYPATLEENYGFTVLTLILFMLISAVASSLESKKSGDK